MDFSFFIIDNKSGYKTREKWFSKNHPEEYKKINEYANSLNIPMTFKEKIYFYYFKLKERPRCKTCGGEIKFRNRLDKPYGDFCSLTCINSNKEEMTKRIKKTINEKYGVNFFTEHPDFIKKQRITKKNRYGDENFNNVEKMKKTKKDKYGNENFNNIDKVKITMLTKYGNENYSKSNKYVNELKENYKKLYPNLNFIEIKKKFVKIKCEKCNQISEITKQMVYERDKRGYDVCIHCNPIGQSNRSGYEIELEDFIKSLNIPYKTSDRKILNKGEIDFLFPTHNLGLEFNGLYWHNELFIDSDYHLRKTIELKEKNIDLVHIFEDEWVYKPEIVKSILKNKFNLIDKKIYARKCIIKEIDNETSRIFLEKNHIQGNVNSKVRIGLYYNDELVSLMTFSKGRIIMGGKSDEWELNRFANVINTNVIGGASKLFKYFIKKYQPKKVISYSDIRLFNGNLYENLGFNYVSQSKPNYWYIINGIRQHRFNFTKSKLIKEGFDINKTEKEIMFERKYYRIYDCGNIRWEYNL